MGSKVDNCNLRAARVSRERPAMPKMTPGNRLYLYQLLTRELGTGRQTAMARVAEALEADGILTEDLGFSDARALCEALSECVKVTVFKKGYVYATMLPCEEYDRALERAAGDAEKGGTGGKPWKRRKGAKALRPVRPRHVERPAKASAQGASPAEGQGGREGQGDERSAQTTEDVAAERGAASLPATEAASPDDAAVPSSPAPAEGGQAPSGDAPCAAPASAGEAPSAPDDPEERQPAPAEKPDQPEPAATAPAAPRPSISLTITYVPEPEATREAPREPAPSLASHADGAASAQPDAEGHERDAATPLSVVTTRAQSDLPQDFHAEVRCPNEQLSALYQLLPPNVDPIQTLEDDFRLARSTGCLDGTRSSVTFPLGYLRSDGSSPVTVTLRRSARAVAGKRWAVVDVDGGDTDGDLEGLSAAQVTGPWAAFAADGEPVPDLERRLVETVALGSWDEALERLASLAAPEDWGDGRNVLRGCLTMAFARVQAEGLLAVSADGRRATFDTGLLTEQGEPVFAALSSQGDRADIPWRLEGFSAGDGAPAAGFATRLSEMALDPSLALPEGVPSARLARSPRLATGAYDPVGNRTVLLVPSGDGSRALALAPREDAYELVVALPLSDAYVCARVVSSEQPSWLRRG